MRKLRASDLDPELRMAVEAILFVVDEPVAANILAQILEVATEEVTAGLHALREGYREERRGFTLREVGGGWRLYTHPDAAPFVERFVMKGRSNRLSQAALETLAVVAYKQPVTRATISEVRGVDADGAIRSLLLRGLIEEVGRADSPGQPLLYGTTTLVLEQLGLDDLSQLPPLVDFEADGPVPPEPPPGGYKAARRELDALDDLGSDA